MATKKSTKAHLKSVPSTQNLETVKAYEMRGEGRSLVYIRNNTKFKTVPDVIAALKEYGREVKFTHFDDDEYHRQTEIDRIDTLQAKMWDIMNETHELHDEEETIVGNSNKEIIDAAKVILTCIKQRSELMGLLKTDMTQANAAVLIIGGKEADYIKGLQAAIPPRTD